MKSIAACLFVMGILLSCFGFLLSNTERLPFVLQMVSPSYINARFALQTLEMGKEVLPGMRGFAECATIYMIELEDQNPIEILSGVAITRFYHPPKVVKGLSVKRGISVSRPLEITLSNGQKLNTTLEALEKKVFRLKAKKLFSWATIIFLFGVFFQILGFFVERVNERDTLRKNISR